MEPGEVGWEGVGWFHLKGIGTNGKLLWTR